MLSNPPYFYAQVKAAARKAFTLQGSEFRFRILARSIGEEDEAQALDLYYDANSIATEDGGRRLYTDIELQEHIITAAIELSNTLPNGLYWNFGVAIQQRCSCGDYHLTTFDNPLIKSQESQR